MTRRTRTLGALLVGSLIVVAVACATAPLSPPTVDVTGNWAGTWQYDNVQMGSGELRGSFQQSGNHLTGNFNVTGPVVNRVANVSGAVSGNEIMLATPSSGRLTVSGNQITGTINGLNVAKVTMRKQ
jgi:hypothetical protein